MGKLAVGAHKIVKNVPKTLYEVVVICDEMTVWKEGTD